MKCKHEWIELARGKRHRNGLSTVMWCRLCGTAKDWVAGRDNEGIWRWYRPKSYRTECQKILKRWRPIIDIHVGPHGIEEKRETYYYSEKDEGS